MNKSYPLMKNNILREDLDKIIDYLKQDDPILTQSKNVAKFEELWSEWLGVKYSVFVNSGSSANLLSLAILKIMHPEGGEVIVPPLTWSSDISSIILNGFTPRFVDIDFHTLGMNNKKIISAITEKTIAVFLTHVQGFNGLTDDLLVFLKEKNIPLIEDVCESHGAMFKEKKLGSYGLISNFSFYYAHHMTTIEGGMICTNDKTIYEQLRMLRSHGMAREISDPKLKQEIALDNAELNPDFIFMYPSYNVRNNEIGGILGISQLPRLDNDNIKRNNNLFKFLDLLNEKIFFKDFLRDGCSNYAFNLIIKDPDIEYTQKLMKKMKDNKIEFRRGSAGGGNQLRQPYLRDLFPDKYYLEFPKTDHVHFFGFYIGNFPSLHQEDIERICDIINST
tara:strand:- start:6660 stop:7835 length:1176 start_codon:yes stop_codon:yes gene_type:complete